MTVKELINKEQKKHPKKEIGNEIALEIVDRKGEEYYFWDCWTVDCIKDWEELENKHIHGSYYTENYANIKGKLKLTVVLGAS